MAEKALSSFVKRQLPRAATATVVAAEVISPSAAQAGVPTQRGANCVPPATTLAGHLRQEALRHKAVPLAPDVGVVTGADGGQQAETIVPVKSTTADGQVHYFVPEVSSNRRLSAAKALKSIRFAEIPAPTITMTVQELFAPLDAPLDDPNSFTLTSSSTTGVIDVNDPGHMPETRIHLSNGQNEYVNVGFTRPYTPPPDTLPVPAQ